MSYKTLAWLIVILPGFIAVGVYTFLSPMVDWLLASIGGVCVAVLLLMLFFRSLGLPIK